MRKDKEVFEKELEELPEEYSGPANYEDVLAAQHITFEDVKEHITGPVISLITHVILLVFLGSIIVFHGPEERTDIEVEVREVELKELEKIPEPPEAEEEIVEPEIEVDRPDVETEAVDVDVEDVAVDTSAEDVAVPDLLSVKPSNSALVFPHIMGMRSGAGRKAALKRYGGGSHTERSVVKALRWLRDHQNPDGSWGDGVAEYFPSLSGLALLTFLAHGETPQSPEFGACVLKAIKKLVEWVDRGNGLVAGNYSHGIVMYALSEAYALTKIPMLEATMNKGMTRLIAGQNELGGFNYGYRRQLCGAQQRCDLSVGGWNYQALKAAFSAGCAVPGIEDAIDKGIKCITTVSKNDDNGFKYDNDNKNASRNMTSVGTLCLQLLGAGKTPDAKGGVAWLEKNAFTFDWKQPERFSVYGWYYQVQAFFQDYAGRGGEWKRWNKMFTGELIKAQKTDGHWETPMVDAGKKDNNTEAMFKGIDGPVYATTLCCLMLEVYYRYLPTFKVMEDREDAEQKKDSEKEEDGLKIE